MIRWLTLLILFGLCAGCDDPSRMFHGVWRTNQPVVLGEQSMMMEMAIGHFGDAVTGVVYFFGPEGLIAAECPCAYIDNSWVDLDNSEFHVAAQPCDESTMFWQLKLINSGSNERLEGTITTLDEAQSPGVEADITLLRRSDSVTDSEKECAVGD